MKKSICKFKYENIIYMTLVIAFIYGACIREVQGISNFLTLLIQLISAYMTKQLFRYIRKNPEQLTNDLKSLFRE